MANYKLFIKGDMKNATRAAARRGIPVRNCVTKKHGISSYAEIACDVIAPPQAVRVRIMQWFGEQEPRGGRRGRGAAPGSLLFFNGARRRRR